MQDDNDTKGAGWIMFAGVMMITIGIFQAFAGLVALFNDEFYAVTPDYILQFDATSWGWIHLIIGLIVLGAGFGVFAGNVLARTVGVLVALGSMLSNFAWLPWYPIWAITIIVINIVVIWALTVHGRALAMDRSAPGR